MPDERERRTAPRIRLANRPAARVRGVQEVRLLDLSIAGAQIEHLATLRLGAACAVELPPALGALRLPGRVVWTRPQAAADLGEGHQRSRYESGVEFTNLTPEQQAALALALAAFRAAQAGLGALPTDPPPDGPQGSST